MNLQPVHLVGFSVNVIWATSQQHRGEHVHTLVGANIFMIRHVTNEALTVTSQNMYTAYMLGNLTAQTTTSYIYHGYRSNMNVHPMIYKSFD